MNTRAILLILSVSFSVASTSRARELVVSIALPSELLPTQVCIHATKIGGALAEQKVERVSELAPGKAALVARHEPQCSKPRNPDECDRCDPTPSRDTGGVVCVTRTAEQGSASRDLELQLDNAALSSLQLHGSDLMLGVEQANGNGSPARLTPLGGGYYPGLARAIDANSTLQLELRNRCVQRQLVYSADPATETQPPTQLTVDAGNGRRLELRDRQRLRHLDEGGQATLLVPEPGAVSTVTLVRGDTVYTGTFSYPSAIPIELLATKFLVNWQKSCFLLGRSERDVCPQARLVHTGHDCRQRSATPNECTYECHSRGAITFPTAVRFALNSPVRSSGNGLQVKTSHTDKIVWEDMVRFPSDTLSSFTSSQERRVYFNWPSERWNRRGREIEAIEITTPDGNVHRLGRDADSVNIVGLQCPATFGFRYVGRLPHRTGTAKADGDRLDVPAATQSEVPVTLGLHAHAGALYHTASDSNVSLSPEADLEMTALISRGLSLLDNPAELSLSGTYTEHPSVSAFATERDRWSTARQIKALLYFGYRVHTNDVLYVAPAVGAGFATGALHADSSKSKPVPIASARMRIGYDLSPAVAIEVPLTIGIGEKYVRNHQDTSGPNTALLESTVSFGFALGLQWADVF